MAAVAQSASIVDQFTVGSQLVGQHVWIDQTLGLVTGTYPTPQARFDFADERLVATTNEAIREKKRISHLAKAKRVGKRYELETDDEIHTFGSATQLLVEGLNILEEAAPGTLERFSMRKRRTKRAVARSREELYDLPHPPEHSQKLRSGFYVATNNKDAEARGFLREAAELAGRQWGRDFVVRPLK